MIRKLLNETDVINRVISITMLGASLGFFALAQTNANSMLFLFASSKPLTAYLRLILALAMVVISFNRVLINKRFREVAMYAGFFLLALTAYSTLMLGTKGLNDYVKLLDLYIIAEAGVMLSYYSLTSTIELQSTEAKAAAKNAKKAPALVSRSA